MHCPLEGFLRGSVVKNLPANSGDIGDMCSIPGWGRSPGEGNGNPFQYSCLGNPMDRGAWWTTVHGVAKRHDWGTEHTFACMCTHARRHTHTHTHTHTDACPLDYWGCHYNSPHYCSSICTLCFSPGNIWACYLCSRKWKTTAWEISLGPKITDDVCVMTNHCLC